MAGDLTEFISYTDSARTAKYWKIAEKAEEAETIKNDAIIHALPEGLLSRQEILHAARTVDPSFKETQLRHLMGTLLGSNLMIRVGRNQYKKVEKEPQKSVFTGVYSNAALQVIQYMQEQFPLISFRVWELSWLNEFFNHLIARNQIFLEVEKDGCDFVFSALAEKLPGRVLLRPKAQELLRYGIDDGIIIDQLITEAPKSDGEPYQVPLEKLIVDLFANKNLMLSKGDFPSAIEKMFSRYRIDQVSMRRYARRRNKVKDVFGFLRDQTTIELLVGI
jgi:hypothetical protein